MLALLAYGTPARTLACAAWPAAHAPAQLVPLAYADSCDASVARARLERDAPGEAVRAQATPVPEDGGGQPSAAPVIGVALAFLASTIALGIAFGIRRRIDRLVPPPDEEDD